MKFIKCALSILLICGLLATTVLLLNSCTESSDLEFTLSDDGNSYICLGFKEGKSAAELVIPETHKDLPVTVIADNAFNEDPMRDIYANFFSGKEETEEKVALTSVVIPNTVTEIGDSAFADCVELKAYNIPTGIVSIGSQAFLRSGICGELNLPDTLVEIGSAAFSATDINSARLPNGLEEIPASLFAGCEKMNNVTIPDSVTVIHEKAFYGCESMTNFTFPASIRAIGTQAFGECTGLREITIPTTVTELGAQIFIDTNEELVVNVSYDNERPTNWSEYWFAGMKGKALNTSEAYYNNVIVPENAKAEALKKSLESYEAQYKSIDAQMQSVNQAKQNLQASSSINPPDYVIDMINDYQKQINQLNRTKSEIGSKISEIKGQLEEFKLTNQLN